MSVVYVRWQNPQEDTKPSTDTTWPSEYDCPKCRNVFGHFDEPRVLEHLRKAAGLETESEFVKLPTIPVSNVNPPQVSSTQHFHNEILSIINDEYPDNENVNNPIEVIGNSNSRAEAADIEPEIQVVQLLLDDIPAAGKGQPWISVDGILFFRTTIARA